MSERYTFNGWENGKRPPDGWDCANAIEDGWTRANIFAFIRATIRPWTRPVDRQAAPEPPRSSAGRTLARSHAVIVEPMIEPHDRARAVQFVAQLVRPDIPGDLRRKRAITYAFPNDRCAVDMHDAEPDGEIKICSGRYVFPIFACRRDGEIIGSAICSGVVPGIVTRLMMVGVRLDQRGTGVGAALVRAAISSAPVVCVVPARPELQPWFTALGFSQWQASAAGHDVGFSNPVLPPHGMAYVIPVTTDDQIAEREAWLAANAGARHG